MLAKAEIDSVLVLDAEVDANTQRRMDIILAQSGRTPLELEELYGKTLEQIRSELRDQIREQMIVQKMEETITADLSVTPAEVKRFFNRIFTSTYIPEMHKMNFVLSEIFYNCWNIRTHQRKISLAHRDTV